MRVVLGFRMVRTKILYSQLMFRVMVSTENENSTADVFSSSTIDDLANNLNNEKFFPNQDRI